MFVSIVRMGLHIIVVSVIASTIRESSAREYQRSQSADDHPEDEAYDAAQQTAIASEL
jgi:hypothetical protein